MNNDSDNSDLYRALLNSIVLLSVQRMLPKDLQETAAKGETILAKIVFHSFGQGYIAKAHNILHESGIARRHREDDYTKNARYRMLTESSDPASEVLAQAARGESELPPIEDVVEAWISIACAHHNEVPDSRCEFEANVDVKPVMLELVKAGYATQYKGQFVWTNKIGPAMQANYLWNEKNQCNAEVYASEELMELRAAAKSAPEFIRSAALKDGLGVAYIGLSTFWDGEVWKSLDDWDGRTKLSGGIERAERFLEIMRGSSSQPKAREHLIPSLSRLFSAQIMNDEELDAMDRGRQWIQKLREENNK